MRTLFLSLTLSLALMGISCKKDGTVWKNTNKATDLGETPETILIDNREYYITAYLWRDFMPGSEKNGSPLMCEIKLLAKDGNVMPSDVELVKVQVVNGSRIWTVKFEKSKNSGLYFEGTVRNGPKWDTGITVNVICEFTLAGKSHKVQAKQQLINTTV